MRQERRSFIIRAVLFVVAAGALGAAYYLIGCPFRFFFGVPCPGCGMTRAWTALFKGDIAGAFRWHPLFLVIPAFVLLLTVKKGRVFQNKRLNTAFSITLWTLILGVYVIRMLYLFPDTEPLFYDSGAVVNRIISVISG